MIQVDLELKPLCFIDSSGTKLVALMSFNVVAVIVISFVNF